MKKVAFFVLCVFVQPLWAHIFRVYCYSGMNEYNPIECYKVNQFNEYTITWNNRPQPGVLIATLNSSAVHTWYEFSSPELTRYIDSCVAHQHPICFRVKRQIQYGNNIIWYFYSKEQSSTYCPQLVYNNQVFTPTHDARVCEYRSNTNFSSDSLWVCNYGSPYRQEFFVQFDISPIGIEEGSRKGIRFLRATPNIFSSFTRISYNLLPEDAGKLILLSIYDISGNLVMNLVNRIHDPGCYEVVWNGKDENGNLLPSGCYFYKLKVGETTLTTKGLLLR